MIDVTEAIEAIPSRSILYPLAPIGVKPSEVESLTSYINRLAWTYGIGPRVFITETVLPNFSDSHSLRLFPKRLGPFCREDAMSINAAGENAANWTSILERLTTCPDLSKLTLYSWASELPPRGLLRKYLAWCPECYSKFREGGLPIYQPLCWLFQITVICLKHRRWLEDLCPSCQKFQSAIAVWTRPGYCTQCGAWLGMEYRARLDQEVDEDIYVWQQWVMHAITDFQQFSADFGPLKWINFPANIAMCAQMIGGVRPFARIVGLPPAVPQHWITGYSIPSFKCLLELCYVLGVSPLQLVLNDAQSFSSIWQTHQIRQHPFAKRLVYSKIDEIRALRLINSILDGESSLSVRQVERLLGIGNATLIKHFPDECALLVKKYRDYSAERSKKKIERECNEVRELTYSLYKQGLNPSKYRISAELSNPDLMRRPECRIAWHETRRELGLE